MLPHSRTETMLLAMHPLTLGLLCLCRLLFPQLTCCTQHSTPLPPCQMKKNKQKNSHWVTGSLKTCVLSWTEPYTHAPNCVKQTKHDRLSSLTVPLLVTFQSVRSGKCSNEKSLLPLICLKLPWVASTCFLLFYCLLQMPNFFRFRFFSFAAYALWHIIL